MSEKEIKVLNIDFDFSNPFAIARVPYRFNNALFFANQFVYTLVSYVADTLKIDHSKVVLVAISKNNKVVVISFDPKYRDGLYEAFHKESVGNSQLYDDVEPELIIEKLKELFNQS